MYIFLFSLFLAYVLAIAIWGYWDQKKMKGKKYTENEKVKNYKKGIVIGWIPVLIFIPICLFLHINLYDLGFRSISLNYNIWFNLITITVCVVIFAYILLQIISYLTSEKHREKIKMEMLKSGNELMYNVILPHTIKEKKYFFGIALTAGICEETIFRGFLFFILQTLFPGLSIVFIMVMASVLFGIGHLYQGIGGVIKTAITGALLCCLYVVTNSLFLGMILHFIIDFSSAFLIREEEAIENKI